MTGKVIVSILKIFGKLSVVLPGAILKRKSGIKAFEKQLKSMSLEKDVIDELCHEYKNIISFKDFNKDLLM